MHNLSYLFNPRSIAIIGASNNPFKWGCIILANILSGGYRGKIYPINKKEKKIHDLDVYQDIENVPDDDIDLAIIVIPADNVIEELKKCINKKVKSIVLVSSDFSEAGNIEREKKVIDTIKPANIPLVGPNTMGISSAEASLYALMPPVRPKSGVISFVAQSGNLGTQLLGQGQTENIGFSKFVCSGNEATLRCEDYIEYFGEDKSTKVILAYIEGIRDGKKFLQVAKSVSRKKPIIVFKSGRTKKGAEAAKSHSAALAGEDKIYDAVFRQCGIIRAQTPEEMLDLGYGFSFLPLPKGNRVGIITWGGGWGVVATDFCEEQGLNVVDLPSDVIEKLDKLLPPYWPHNNPVDLVAIMDREVHLKCFDILVSCSQIDAVLALGVVATSSRYASIVEKSKSTDLELISQFGETMIKSDIEFAKRIEELQQQYGKPIIGVSVYAPEHKSEKLAIFKTPDKAVRVLSELVKYKRYLERKE